METRRHDHPAATPPSARVGEARFPDDPEMAALADLFFGELSGRIDSMRRAMGRQDLGSIQFIAHQLRGAAGGYGFPEIGAAAGSLEDLLRRGDAAADAIERGVQAIESMQLAAAAG
jgi:HPt (histidine-containing phosphotransfer) domain-containing protein